MKCAHVRLVRRERGDGSYYLTKDESDAVLAINQLTLIKPLIRRLASFLESDPS